MSRSIYTKIIAVRWTSSQNFCKRLDISGLTHYYYDKPVNYIFNMAKRKIKSLREQREERIRKFKEMSEQRFEKYRDRLLKVNTPGKKWGILDRENFFVCGYCSFRMSVFSTRSLQVNEETPMLFYGCGKRCEPSNIHRVSFVDDKLIDHVYDRLNEKFPNAKPVVKDMGELMASFTEIDELEEKRRHLMELLPHAGYNRDDMVQELIEIEERMETIRDENSGLKSTNPAESRLLSPVFSAKDPSEIYPMNLSYKTELVKTLVRRIRFFNETIIVKMNPLDEEEASLDKAGGGKITNIHLAYHYRGYQDGDAETDEDTEAVDDGRQERPRWERVDIDFIMSEPEEKSDFIKATEKLDIDLVRTEPGSKEEKEILKNTENEKAEEEN